MFSRFVAAGKEGRLSLENYHLPGIGTLEVNLLPYTEQLIKLLERYGHIKKLHETNQLGSLRQLYQGAHHTRYEYVFLQWAIADRLSEKSENLPNQIGLSCQHNKLPKGDKLSKHPSGREVLQCLSLLTNIGHFKETFAGSRALLCLLKRDSDFRISFRKGLDTSVRSLFDECLDSMNEYKIHLFVGLFLLERYRRARQYKGCIEFSRNLLSKFLLRDQEKFESLSLVFRLFDAIRRTAYLLLDSHMSATPFKVDSSAVFAGALAYHVYEEDNPALSSALNNMERILQNFVYMEGKALLASQNCTERQLKKSNKFFGGINSVYQLIGPQSKTGVFNSSENLEYNLALDQHKVVEVEFANLPDTVIGEFLNRDYYELSHSIQRAVGKKNCLVGCQSSSNGESFKIAYGIHPNTNTLACFELKKRILAETIRQEIRMSKVDYTNNRHESNLNRLVTFLLGEALVQDYRVILDYRKVSGRRCPFIVSMGSTSASDQLEEYANYVEKFNLLNDDEVFEVRKTGDVIRKIAYKGLTLIYLGSTKILQKKDTVAEIDGTIVFPTRKDRCVVIVEAKNKHNGTQQAKKQLQCFFNKNLMKPVYAVNLHSVVDAAYAEISY